ncbi:hypothetical protein MPH_00088 [Macrophomina phaseolina MS6]|uniref:Uncharacterized protein n=1 Tax=Macrophomina phaseolina (strain MS6) TaxID=1126212 RepID=K2T0U5_MACPH|nr:hypothetical protein MPH_00088 [Macrophomina phaseolina MS6]
MKYDRVRDRTTKMVNESFPTPYSHPSLAKGISSPVCPVARSQVTSSRGESHSSQLLIHHGPFQLLAVCLGSIAMAAAAPSTNILEARQFSCGWESCIQNGPFSCMCCPSGKPDALIVTNVCRHDNNDLIGAAPDGTCPGCSGAVSQNRSRLTNCYYSSPRLIIEEPVTCGALSGK